MNRRFFTHVTGVGLLLCGLFGCAAPQMKREAVERKAIDSLWRVEMSRKVSTEWHGTKGGGNVRIREMFFSAPDDSGRQYVEKLKVTDRVWRQTDSTRIEQEWTRADTLRVDRRETTLAERLHAAFSSVQTEAWLRSAACFAGFFLLVVLFVRFRVPFVRSRSGK